MEGTGTSGVEPSAPNPSSMPPKRKSSATPAASPRRTRSTASPSKTTNKEEEAAPPPVAQQEGGKRAKMAAAVEENGGAAVEDSGGAAASDGKRVVVEACTQCRQFKIRALKVKEDLESAVPGVSVIINPEKPRRGCLEIRLEGGEVFISLLFSQFTTVNLENRRRAVVRSVLTDLSNTLQIYVQSMPRPFTSMKKLDMDEVIKDIAKKIS